MVSADGQPYAGGEAPSNAVVASAAGHLHPSPDRRMAPERPAWSPAGAGTKGWSDYIKEHAEDRRDSRRRVRSSHGAGDEGYIPPMQRGLSSTRTGPAQGAVVPFAASSSSSSSGMGLTAVNWRLSLTLGPSARTRRALRQHAEKIVENVPVFPGLDTLALGKMALTSLQGFGRYENVVTIYLHNNLLTSLDGFVGQPHLRQLHVADNHIENLRGLGGCPWLDSVTFAGNPIASHPHYRLMVICAVGKSLRSIDGETVRRHEVETAKALGKVVGDAVRNGWILGSAPVAGGPGQHTRPRNPPDVSPHSPPRLAGAEMDLTLEQYMYARRFGAPPSMPAAPSAPAPAEVAKNVSAPSAARSLSYQPTSPTMRAASAHSRSRSPLHRPLPVENIAAGAFSRASSGGKPSSQRGSRKGFRFGEYEEDEEEDRGRGRGDEDLGLGNRVSTVGDTHVSISCFDCTQAPSFPVLPSRTQSLEAEP